MKYKWDKKYLYWGITALAVIIAARLLDAIFISGTTVFGSFISKLLGALSPVFYGFAFAYLLNPVENFFTTMSEKKRAKIDPYNNYAN